MFLEHRNIRNYNYSHVSPEHYQLGYHYTHYYSHGNNDDIMGNNTHCGWICKTNYSHNICMKDFLRTYYSCRHAQDNNIYKN